MSDLPEGWKSSPLNKIANVVDCEHKTAPKINSSEYYSIRTTDIKNGKIDYANANRVSEKTYLKWISRATPTAHDIILAREAPVGEVGWIQKGYLVCLGQRTVLIKVTDENIYKNFLLYYLMTRKVKLQFEILSTGSVVPHLNMKDIREYKISYPALLEQKAIANILTAFDKKIALLQAQNQTLETLAQTVFKEWFVDSDDRPTSITDIIEFNPIEKIDRKREYLFFDMKSISTNSMVMSESIFKKSNSGTSFREMDTLFAKITPCLENGKTAFVLDLKGEEIARGSTEFIVMRAKENGSPYLNYCLARYSVFRDYAIKSMIGTSGRQRVPIERIKSFKINYSLNNSIKFHHAIKPFFEKIKNNSKQISSLTNGRNTLLPNLMSGKVRLKNG